MVGDWRAFDLPRRNRDGSIYYPYHAENVISGRDDWQPDPSNLWEHAGSLQLRSPKNPNDMEPIDLTVPEMTAEEAETAALWRKVDEVRELLNNDEDDPAKLLLAAKDLILDNPLKVA